MSRYRPAPLLICSLGNPGPRYAKTLHSAGHTVLQKLAEQLGLGGFRRERGLGNGHVARTSNGPDGRDWTLWQSTSLMNESGPGVRAAWKTWSQGQTDGEGRLVVVHDELERGLGSVLVRTQAGASARGHNGLKSVMGALGRDSAFARVGIGIGRPASREPEMVAQYVLRRMTAAETAAIEGCVETLAQKLTMLEQRPWKTT